MSRYIDAELLLDDMKAELEKAKEENLTIDDINVILTSAIALKDFVNRQPTADVVEVVRCKDCIIHDKCSTEDVFIFTGVENPFCCAGKKAE